MVTPEFSCSEVINIDAVPFHVSGGGAVDECTGRYRQRLAARVSGTVINFRDKGLRQKRQRYLVVPIGTGNPGMFSLTRNKVLEVVINMVFQSASPQARLVVSGWP